MTKREIKKQINFFYKETIAHNELPKEFKEGMANFKRYIFNYIVSIKTKTKRL